VNACIASHRIMVDGMSVGYCYREGPEFEGDSGWRFLSGDESEEYMEEPEHHSIYECNAVAERDPEVLPLLIAPVGSAFQRQGKKNLLKAIQ